jgi:hypothetical protein
MYYLTHKTLSLTLIILFKRFFKYKIKVETKAHLCFLTKVGGALWVCIWNQGGGGPKMFGNRWCRYCIVWLIQTLQACVL